MWENVMWLGVPKEEIKRWDIQEGDMTGRFACFRCEKEVQEESRLTLRITANSRYRLWINEQPVLSGPCKGNLYRCYYDTVDVSEYLVKGKNIFAVQVLYNDPYSAVDQRDERACIFGVVSAGGGHRLALEGDLKDCNGKITGTVSTGKADWKVWLDGSFYLKSYEVTENLGAVCEEIDFRQSLSNWKNREFCDESWAGAVALEPVAMDEFRKKVGLVMRFPLKEREIPLLYEREAAFLSELECGNKASGILMEEEITVPAHSHREIFLDAGYVVNGYPRFCFREGSGSEIRITYFEKFMNREKEIPRDDWKNGTVEGRTDRILTDGTRLCYEPFWYRTFRFIRMEIITDEEALVVERPDYRRTGYPLQVESYVRSSADWVEKVWEICVRTLENCMMETYMDCPYYEQMQFTMDTRLQAMFNYAVSTDTRLARKALEDFHSSMIPEGLAQGKYPSAYIQIISTFSLHYIYMLKEYYMHTGDMEAVRGYLPDIDRILGYYQRKIGDMGLVENLGYWEFVDWQPAWADCAGAPEATLHGPSTIINLMYGYGLLCGAQLYEAAGRQGMGEEYRRRQLDIIQRVEKYCWDKEKEMYREGPGFRQFTQHAQAWAVLNGMTDTAKSRKILQNAMDDPQVLKVTFSTSYEWFRALDVAGMYASTEENIMQWAGFLKMGCTTCPETPGISRSECHAWSALPLYEFICSAAGIRPLEAGWERALIRPQLFYLPDLSGEAVTPKGIVRFRYEKDADGNWKYEITLPPGLQAKFVYPDGSSKELTGGYTEIRKEV